MTTVSVPRKIYVGIYKSSGTYHLKSKNIHCYAVLLGSLINSWSVSDKFYVIHERGGERKY